MALGVLELSYKKLAFQECERGLGGHDVVHLGLLGLDIGLKSGLDVGSRGGYQELVLTLGTTSCIGM